jgi:hypothetical protein
MHQRGDGIIVGDIFAQRLQHHGLAGGDVFHAIEQRHARCVQYGFDLQSVQFVAFPQARRQRKSRCFGQTVAQGSLRQRVDRDDECRAVVAAARRLGLHHQCRSQGVDIAAAIDERRDARVAQGIPHAVAEQHETVADLKLPFRVIDGEAWVEADRAMQHIRQFRVGPGVVLGQLRQLAGTMQIDA